MLPGENEATGEAMKSKCRIASCSVLAGGALPTCASSAREPDTSTTGGTVITVGVVPEPSWISAVRMEP